MTLYDWMTLNGMTDAAMAARLRCARQTFWRYRTGQRDIPAKVAQQVVDVTGGEVTPNDLHAVRMAHLRSVAHAPAPPPAMEAAA